jgi:hypothetical protein
MRAGFGVIASLAVLALTVPGRSQSLREPASSDRPIAFQDISVIPMESSTSAFALTKSPSRPKISSTPTPEQ